MNRSQARSPEAIEFARAQRVTANEFANLVWQFVRNRQICNQKFRREVAIPPYTADFCCVELKLILEVDGADHFTDAGKARDHVRDEFLERHGYRILRLNGYEVLREPGEMREKIVQQVRERMRELEQNNPSPPAPLPSEGRGETDKDKDKDPLRTKSSLSPLAPGTPGERGWG